MSLGRTRSVALTGLEGALVDVEADIAQGLPHFAVSGLPDTACLQSTDRIKAGTSNSGVPLPQRRITVNLSPASIPKSGTAFDLSKGMLKHSWSSRNGDSSERTRSASARARGGFRNWGVEGLTTRARPLRGGRWTGGRDACAWRG